MIARTSVGKTAIVAIQCVVAVVQEEEVEVEEEDETAALAVKACRVDRGHTDIQDKNTHI